MTDRNELVKRAWEAIGTYSVQVATTGELAPSPALCEAIEALAAPAQGGQGEAYGSRYLESVISSHDAGEMLAFDLQKVVATLRRYEATPPAASVDDNDKAETYRRGWEAGAESVDVEGLRAAVIEMTSLLSNNEWADTFPTDGDAAALHTEITRLQAFLDAAKTDARQVSVVTVEQLRHLADECEGLEGLGSAVIAQRIRTLIDSAGGAKCEREALDRAIAARPVVRGEAPLFCAKLDENTPQPAEGDGAVSIAAMDRCVADLRQMIELAADYDLDEMQVQSLLTGIEAIQIRTRPAATAVVPEGFVLVPKKATPEMLAAARMVAGSHGLEAAWDDMLATAPAAPAAPKGGVVVSIEAAEAMGAVGGPASEPERQAFEAWMRGHCWSLCATWNGTEYRSDAEQGGRYCPQAASTRQLWAAWRDRAALATGEQS